MVGVRELLCDGCNLRFRGFVLPGTLPRSGRHRYPPKKEKPARVEKSAEPAPATRPRSEPKRCQNCGSESTHRSHRRGIIENLASVLRIYPYRCDNCNKRFLGRRRSTTPEPG